MSKRGATSKFVHSVHPLILAIIIDLIKIIPYVDIFITIWLQIVLWNRLEHEPFKWLNISYDISFDIIHPFADCVPLNTICVLILMVYKKFPNHNI